MHEADAARRVELGEFIRSRRRSLHLSLRRLSQVSGVSNPYLSQIERGLRKPSAEVLQQIATALVVPAEQLYIRAGILEPGADGDLIGHIRRDPALTVEQKDALERLYRQFRDDPRSRGGEEPTPG